MATNALVKLLGDKKIWINWTLEQAKNTDDTPKFNEDGTPKMTKIPRRLNGAFASVSDPTSWSTFAQADEAREKFSGVGVVFEDSLKLVGVDLDHYIKNGKLSNDAVLAFLMEADTYTEKSPSGTGLHVFFQTTEPFDPIAKKHHDEEDDNLVTEIYSRGRYFTFTGDVYGELGNRPPRVVAIDELNKILGILGYPWGKELYAPQPQVVNTGLAMFRESDDEVILEKMFSSRNGVNIRALYESDLSANGNDHSSADMALVSHLAFWTGKNPEQMRRIWLSSPLGNRPKTQERLDYQNRTIDAAIKNCREVYRPSSTKSAAEGLDTEIDFICTNKKGVPDLIVENIVRVFEHDPAFMGLFRLNSFSNMIECWEGQRWMNLVDYWVIKAQTRISVAHPYFSRVSQEMCTAAIKMTSANHAVNPPVDWLRSLTWDRIPRLDSWLYKTYGTPDDDLHQSMGANFLKGMVSRITNPGCQMDLVLCLEGEQGTRKSSSLRTLAGEWFAENVTSVDSKDDMIVFAGSILVEFSEGAVLGKASIAKLKSVITTTVDKFRPPYERGLVSFPRGCVFSLSTNDTAYLKDETGGRRFLIVKLGKVADTAWLKENRNQLFAEALYRVENGETAYEFTDISAEMLKDLQESRTEDTAYDELVVDWYLGRSRETQEAGITVMDAYTGAINTGGNSKEMPQQLEWKLRGILRRALYLSNEVMPRDENGKRSRRYVPTAKTIKKFALKNETSIDGVDEFVKYKRTDSVDED